MKYKNNKKRHSVYASVTVDLYFLTFVEMKYATSILLSLKRNTLMWEIHFKILLSVNKIHNFRKSTSNILLSFKK